MSRLLAAQANPAAVEAVLSRDVVSWALLLELQFVSGTIRLSNTSVPVTTADGAVWQGLGDLVGVSDMDGGPDNLAPLREYHLGVPWEFLGADSVPSQASARIPALIGDAADYRGRPANLFAQLFDADAYDASGRALPVGVPVALDAGTMTNVGWSFGPGHGGVVLTLRVESVLARKGAPLFGLLTDRDQKRRYVDDEGLRYVPEVMSTAVKWTDW
jgi:hypothetical protein